MNLREEKEKLLDRILAGAESNGSFRVEADDSGVLDVILKAEKYPNESSLTFIKNELIDVVRTLNVICGQRHGRTDEKKAETIRNIKSRSYYLIKEISSHEKELEAAATEERRHQEMRADNTKAWKIGATVTIFTALVSWWLTRLDAKKDIDQRDIQIEELKKQIPKNPYRPNIELENKKVDQ